MFTKIIISIVSIFLVIKLIQKGLKIIDKDAKMESKAKAKRWNQKI